MKQYRLLKDIPFAKAGDTVEMWSDGTMAFGDPTLPRFNKKDVRMFPLWFEEVEDYFYITTDGSVWLCPKNKNKELDKNRKAIGNYFETIEKAEEYLAYLKAKTIIKKDTKGFKPNWNDPRQEKYYCYWDVERKEPKYSLSYTTKEPSICFETWEDVKESFKNHPEAWKTYLTYE
jgi:hypothetical protein|nr:MAG TPA: hypothetical protein [Caudoviricetes sp.]